MNSRLPSLPISREKLREGAIGDEADLELPGGLGAPGFALGEPARVTLRAEESGDGSIRVIGTVSVRLTETCSRCLGETVREREIPIDIRFEPGLDAWDEGPQLYALEADRERVDVGPALREELVLALPEYPVCRAECRGLCPRCGADLNQGDCDCGEEPGDARWDALRRQLTPDDDDTNDDEPRDG